MNTPTEDVQLPPASRREFLKKTVTAAAATATLTGLELSRSAHAAGSDLLRVGMIGCGGRNSGAALQALTADPGARLVAMCDIFMDRIKAKRTEIKSQRPSRGIGDAGHCFP